jgi:hypothetical protein
MCMTLKKKVLFYDIKKRNLKWLTYFGMIQNYDKFSRWKPKSNKIYTLWKIHIYLVMSNMKYVIYWGNYMYF